MGKNTKAYLALLFICITWGTTYLAIRVGVTHYPAILFAGARQSLGGLILLIIGGLFIKKKKDLSLRNILQQMGAGLLLITLGNGGVTWGEKNVPSGVAALLCAMMPIFAVLFNLLLSKKEHFNITIAIGLLLGLFGVGLIFRKSITSLTTTAYLIGMLSILMATSSWALGSVLNKKRGTPQNPLFNAGLQVFFGGCFLLIGSPFLDDYHQFQLWQPHAVLALLYLAIFGSVLAFAAYMYVLRELPVGIATIYAYVNPLVAVVLGYLVLNEPLNIFTALAFVTIVVGVYLVNRGYRQQHKRSEIKDFGDNAMSALPATSE